MTGVLNSSRSCPCHKTQRGGFGRTDSPAGLWFPCLGCVCGAGIPYGPHCLLVAGHGGERSYGCEPCDLKDQLNVKPNVS